MTRRVMLAAGGLTLLSACGAAAKTGPVAAVVSTSARTSPSPTATTPTDPDGTGTPPPSPTGPNVPSDEGAASYTAPQYYVHDGPKVISVTFDDGPDPMYTPQILRILARYNVIGTFNTIGGSVSRYPSVVRDVAEAGHLLSNHTYTHADLQHRTETQISREISRTNEIMFEKTGSTPTHFRAPYGAWSPTVLTVCKSYSLRPLDWSVDPRDWSRPGTSHIVNTVMEHTSTGSIILEHDGGGDRSQTVAALAIWLPRLIDAGYKFTTP